MWAPQLRIVSSVKLPMGPRSEATNRCSGWAKMPNWACGAHAGGPIGALGGAPVGPRSAVLGERKRPIWMFRDARGRWHVGIRWSSQWGHAA
eukprot:539726-Pyramimonas_sp.AAC.1